MITLVWLPTQRLLTLLVSFLHSLPSSFYFSVSIGSIHLLDSLPPSTVFFSILPDQVRRPSRSRLYFRHVRPISNEHSSSSTIEHRLRMRLSFLVGFRWKRISSIVILCYLYLYYFYIEICIWISYCIYLFCFLWYTCSSLRVYHLSVKCFH